MDKVVTRAAADTEHWADTGDMIRINSWFFSHRILFWLLQKLWQPKTHKYTTMDGTTTFTIGWMLVKIRTPKMNMIIMYSKICSIWIDHRITIFPPRTILKVLLLEGEFFFFLLMPSPMIFCETKLYGTTLLDDTVDRVMYLELWNVGNHLKTCGN